MLGQLNAKSFRSARENKLKGAPFFLRLYSRFKKLCVSGYGTAYLLIALVFTSCTQLKDAASETFTYSFSEGFCETGAKSFSTNAAMCSALQNNSLNNGCAQALRQNYFYSKCPGPFTPSSLSKPLFQIKYKSF